MSAVVGYEWARLPAKWPRVKTRSVLTEVMDPSPDGAEPLFMLSRERGLLPRADQAGVAQSATYAGYKRFGTNDLVLNKMQAWNGVFGLASAPGLISPDYAVFRLLPNASADVRFLCYLLRTPVYAGLFAGLSRGMGTGFNRLHPGQLLDVPLSLPPLNDQRRIADFLDEQVALLDRAIDLRRKQTALLVELLDSRARSLLVDPEAPLTAGAPVRRFVTQVQTGGTPRVDQGWVWTEDAGIGWYGPGSFSDRLRLASPPKKVQDAAITQRIVPCFPAGSVLLVGIGATAGRVAFLDHPATGNQQITALIPAEGIAGRYLAWALWAHRTLIRTTAPFTTLPIINNDFLRSVRLPLMDGTRQQSVVSELDGLAERVDDVEALHLRSLRLLAERKQALITAAVTGQFAVTTARSVA